MGDPSAFARRADELTGHRPIVRCPHHPLVATGRRDPPRWDARLPPRCPPMGGWSRPAVKVIVWRMPLDAIRTVVADDHPLFREAMVRALVDTGRYTVVGEA